MLAAIVLGICIVAYGIDGKTISAEKNVSSNYKLLTLYVIVKINKFSNLMLWANFLVLLIKSLSKTRHSGLQLKQYGKQ